ncbi:GH92 family glycosyl hydrolase [Sphingobacterium sp. WM]|uniref:GH92 family glycosyl hydrolase n=1 Tax=Sphingobacterium sp. WM TaxID=3031802 RepID=UPI00240D8497|nr:GH92 family glycosyl hydrolase [Sphingobacterium sp. WM]WFB62231.1 GH92 family glycosyl hydrolase [Sphingobacterium sp. WM]
MMKEFLYLGYSSFKNMQIKSIILGVISILTYSFGQAQTELGPSRYVNPFIGASTNTASSVHGLGKTFPGATTPFGMTQVSPNTITGGDNGSGYSYEHKTLEGFAFTQMSGVGWYGDLGNFLVMPTTGPLRLIAGKEGNTELDGYRSTYDKSTEKAEAGYYSVFLDRYQIKAEATASPYGGMLRFTFPENDSSRIQIDLARRVGGTSTRQAVDVVDERTIRGWIKCDPSGGGWGDGAGQADYTVYFYAEFSKPLLDYGFWALEVPDDQKRKNADVASVEYQKLIEKAHVIKGASGIEAEHVGFFLEFPTKDQEQVTLKVGISFTDQKGAENNFYADVHGKNFRTMQQSAREAWDKALGKIEVEGGTEDEKTIFYTALYHTMIDPRNITDVDGRYPRPNGQVHLAEGFTKRTIFSGWDVFRSQFPLQTIINPKLVNDEINSLMSLATQSNKNYLERWEFFNAYSGCMVGNPALSVIADAYAKGIRGYNKDEALDLMIKTSDKFGNGELGYVPVENGYGISETLEFAYGDWCIAQMAKELGKKDIHEKYLARSKYYKNIFDSKKGWFRPKHADGKWQDWPKEGRLKEWYGSIESNPYQQGWFVPHDVEGMVELMGGREKVLADLQSFFENTPQDFLWNNYYNHANEPVHHVPFLFNRLGAPSLTQKWTRYICEHAYKNSVEGLTGNEDVGQMSAWYVLAASGIHPIAPGDPTYEITSPVFSKVTFNLDNGKKFQIIANNNSKENLYIQSATLNGKSYGSKQLSHEDLVKGGSLVLEMGKEGK